MSEALDRRRAWRLRHPEKHAAQRAVEAAVKSGKLEREPCLFCDAPRAQAHHHDYGLPLVVTWLCAFHHHLAHGRARARAVSTA